VIAIAIAAVTAVVVPSSASAATRGWTVAAGTEDAVGAACADVLFIGARGSGEPYADADGSLIDDGYGPMVRTVRDGVRVELGDRVSVRQYALDYSATPIDRLVSDFTQTLSSIARFAGPTVSSFLESADVGTVRVTEALEDSAERCPDERWVLAGYSQGSLAMHSALLDLADTRQLAATVLIADPARDAEAPDAAPGEFHGTREPGGRGSVTLAKVTGLLALTAKLDIYGALGPMPAEVRSTVIEVCNQGDVVCDTSRTMPAFGGLHDIAAWGKEFIRRAYEVHGHYGTDDPSADGIDAAALVGFGVEAAERVEHTGVGGLRPSTERVRAPSVAVPWFLRREYTPGLAERPVMA
jgi:hypothetical protein